MRISRLVSLVVFSCLLFSCAPVLENVEQIPVERRSADAFLRKYYRADIDSIGLSKVKRLAVVSFLNVFHPPQSVAEAMSGGGNSRGGALGGNALQVTSSYEQLLDELQAVTDSSYECLAKSLIEHGGQVIGPEQVANSPVYMRLVKNPEVLPQDVLVCSPKGLKLGQFQNTILKMTPNSVANTTALLDSLCGSLDLDGLVFVNNHIHLFSSKYGFTFYPSSFVVYSKDAGRPVLTCYVNTRHLLDDSYKGPFVSMESLREEAESLFPKFHPGFCALCTGYAAIYGKCLHK